MLKCFKPSHFEILFIPMFAYMSTWKLKPQWTPANIFNSILQRNLHCNAICLSRIVSPLGNLLQIEEFRAIPFNTIFTFYIVELNSCYLMPFSGTVWQYFLKNPIIDSSLERRRPHKNVLKKNPPEKQNVHIFRKAPVKKCE